MHFCIEWFPYIITWFFPLYFIFSGICPAGLLKAQDKTFDLEGRSNSVGTNPDRWFLSEETNVKLTVSPMPIGMEPENWLQEREGIWRSVSCVRFPWIDWLRLFPCRSRICNIFKLKMDGGMLPERSFCEKFEFSRYTKSGCQMWMEWDRRKSFHSLKLPVRKPRCRVTLARTRWVDYFPFTRFEAPQDCWSSILWYLRNCCLPGQGFEAYYNCWGLLELCRRVDSGSTLSPKDTTSHLALMATLRWGSFVGVLGLWEENNFPRLVEWYLWKKIF